MSTSLPASSRRNPRRRWFFALTTGCLALLVAELIGRGGLWFIETGNWQRVQALLAESGVDDAQYSEALHPYVGFCHDPNTSPGADFEGRHVAVNRFGFFGPDPIQRRASNRVIIGFFGGSFAWEFVNEAGETFIQALQADPRFADREIVLVDLALPGYKQPQQVLAYNYIAAVGGEFDLVINLDGFNEVALSSVNHQEQAYYAYPKGWITRIHDVPDNRQLTESHRILAIRGERQKLARNVLNSPVRWSALRQLWWRLQDKALERTLNVTAIELKNFYQKHGQPYAMIGPWDKSVSLDDLFIDAADLWERSSRQFAAVVPSTCRYYHALQPNLHLKGSKPLSPEEQSLLTFAHAEFQQAVQQGYPLLLLR